MEPISSLLGKFWELQGSDPQLFPLIMQYVSRQDIVSELEVTYPAVRKRVIRQMINDSLKGPFEILDMFYHAVRFQANHVIGAILNAAKEFSPSTWPADSYDYFQYALGLINGQTVAWNILLDVGGSPTTKTFLDPYFKTKPERAFYAIMNATENGNLNLLSYMNMRQKEESGEWKIWIGEADFKYEGRTVNFRTIENLMFEVAIAHQQPEIVKFIIDAVYSTDAPNIERLILRAIEVAGFRGLRTIWRYVDETQVSIHYIYENIIRGSLIEWLFQMKPTTDNWSDEIPYMLRFLIEETKVTLPKDDVKKYGLLPAISQDDLMLVMFFYHHIDHEELPSEYLQFAIHQNSYKVIMTWINSNLITVEHHRDDFLEILRKDRINIAMLFKESQFFKIDLDVETQMKEPLIRIVKSDRIELIKLLQYNVKWYKWDYFYARLAAEFGSYEILSLLCYNDMLLMDINLTTMNHEAIRMAAANGHVRMVKFLLTFPEVNPAAMNYEALVKAVSNGHTNVVRVLLDDKRVGATISRGTVQGLMKKAVNQDLNTLLAEFLENGYKPSFMSILRDKIHNAIATDDVDAVRQLFLRIPAEDRSTEHNLAYKFAAGLGAENVLIYLIGEVYDIDLMIGEGAMLSMMVRTNAIKALDFLLRRRSSILTIVSNRRIDHMLAIAETTKNQHAIQVIRKHFFRAI